MPGYTVHTYFGAAILDRWRQSGDSPFRLTDTAHRNSFFAGCVGPDLGYYPGGQSLLADLAHYVRSADLVRELIGQAGNADQTAFALGWASHHMLDAAIHPIVNFAAGEHRGCPPLTFYEDPYAHLAVEIGIEGYYYPQLSDQGVPQAVSLPQTMEGYLRRVLSSVYDIDVPPEYVRRTLATWPRWQSLISALAAGACNEKVSQIPRVHQWTRLALMWSTSLFARRSKLHAITHPVMASDRTLAFIDKVLAELAEHFEFHRSSSFISLPNFNLDTGLVEAKPTYALTINTLDRIKIIRPIRKNCEPNSS